MQLIVIVFDADDIDDCKSTNVISNSNDTQTDSPR
jgi:hypothetical protein